MKTLEDSTTTHARSRSALARASIAALSLSLAVAGSGSGCAFSATFCEAHPDHCGKTSGSGGGGAAGGGGASAGGSGGGGTLPDTLDLVSASSQSASEYEPDVLVTSKGRVVVAWTDRVMSSNDEFHVAYRVSDDRGDTWGDVTSIPLPAGDNYAFDAKLAEDESGAVFVVYFAENIDGSSVISAPSVQLARLAPDEATFGSSTTLTDPTKQAVLYAHPSITALASGDLLVTYAESSTNPILMGSHLVTQLSQDHGASWVASTPTPSSPTQAYIRPCVARSGGRAFLLLAESDLGLTLWRSDDGGGSWPSETRGAVQAADELSKVSLVDDGNCVADGDEVWVLYALAELQGSSTNLPQLTHLRLAHSSNGGVTFDRRTTVEDPEAGIFFLSPHLTLGAGGALHLTYYAGAVNGDPNGSYRRARSTDGGITFEPSVAIYQPVFYSTMLGPPRTVGQYQGLAWADGELHGAFVDNGKPSSHIAAFRIAAP